MLIISPYWKKSTKNFDFWHKESKVPETISSHKKHFMQKIYPDIARNIIDTALTMIEEVGPKNLFYLGILRNGEVDVFCFYGTPLFSMKKEVEEYLKNIETKTRADSDVLIPGTPHRVLGFKIGDLVVAYYGPTGDPHATAIAVAYGMAHHLFESEINPDELSCGTLISFAKSWQEKNIPNNEMVIPLLESVLKAELLAS